MKIAFVSYHYWPPHFGGELLLSIERFESLVERGHQVTILTSGVPGEPSEEGMGNYRILRSPIIGGTRISRAIRRLVFFLWAKRKIRESEFDIIHHGGAGGITPEVEHQALFSLSSLARIKGAKTILVNSLVEPDDDPDLLKRFRNRSKERVFSGVDAIVSVSPAIHSVFAFRYPNSAKMILNGIRDDVFVPLKEDERNCIREHHGVSKDDIVFSFLGTVNERKGFDLLARSFISFSQNNPKTKLWLIGPSKESESQNFTKEPVFDYVNELCKLSEKVIFFGRIDDRKELAQIIGSTDVFLFPTRREGMPLAPMEAMAAGIPVIISRIPGVTDLANVDGETGYYIEVGDVDGLEKAMEKLAFSSDLRKRMGQAARRRVVEYFGWQAHVDRWEAFYLDLIGSKGN